MSSNVVRETSGFNARSILVPTIVIGILLLIVWSLFRFFEWKEVDVRKGYSNEANEHQFLAAGRYLTEFDYQVEGVDGLDFFAELPPADHAILTQFLPADLPEQHYEKLTDWINNGGHLISGVIDTSEDSPTSDFLAQFDIRIDSIDWDSDDAYENKIITFALPTGSSPFTIDIEPGYRVLLKNGAEPDFGLKNEHHYHLVQLKKGQGRLTLITDNTLFSNWHIDSNDNALLLKRIVESSNTSTIWINDSHVSFQGIFSLIWEKFKWIVLLLAALMVLLLRRFSVRLGPLEKFPDTESNNFSNHLLAMTRFHYRHGHYEKILNTTRDKLIRKVAAGKDISDAEIIDKIRTKTTLNKGQIKQALFDPVNSTSALTTATATLQSLSVQLSSTHR